MSQRKGKRWAKPAAGGGDEGKAGKQPTAAATAGQQQKEQQQTRSQRNVRSSRRTKTQPAQQQQQQQQQQAAAGGKRDTESARARRQPAKDTTSKRRNVTSARAPRSTRAGKGAAAAQGPAATSKRETSSKRAKSKRSAAGDAGDGVRELRSTTLQQSMETVPLSERHKRLASTQTERFLEEVSLPAIAAALGDERDEQSEQELEKAKRALRRSVQKWGAAHNLPEWAQQRLMEQMERELKRRRDLRRIAQANAANGQDNLLAGLWGSKKDEIKRRFGSKEQASAAAQAGRAAPKSPRSRSQRGRAQQQAAAAAPPRVDQSAAPGAGAAAPTSQRSRTVSATSQSAGSSRMQQAPGKSIRELKEDTSIRARHRKAQKEVALEPPQVIDDPSAASDRVIAMMIPAGGGGEQAADTAGGAQSPTAGDDTASVTADQSFSECLGADDQSASTDRPQTIDVLDAIVKNARQSKKGDGDELRTVLVDASAAPPAPAPPHQWNAHGPLDELRSHNERFADALVQANTIAATALTQRAPDDAVRTPTDRTKADVAFRKQVLELVFVTKKRQRWKKPVRK